MLHEAVLDSEGPSCLGAVGASFVEAKAACSADDAWVVPALPLHEAVRRSCRLGRDSTVYRPSHALHTPTHTLTHLHSPSHALTHPHTPSHTLTRAHSPPPHPDTPSHALTHPHSPSHALTHPHTPSHTLTRPTCPHTPHMPSHTLQVPSFYRLARDHTVFRTVREPAIFFLHFAVMGDRTESNCPVPAATSQPRVGRVTAPLTTAPPTAPHRPPPPPHHHAGACFITAVGVGAALLRIWCFETRDTSRATGLAALAAKLDMGISSQGLLGHLHADAAGAAWSSAPCWRRQPWPPTARGALAFAHAGPLGSRAAPGPLGARATAQGSSSEVADSTAFDPPRRCRPGS